MTVPQHGHARPGSSHSVTFRVISAFDDLRPPRARGLRAVQRRPAAAALRRRIRSLRLARIRVPFQALSLVTGLAAALAVLPALPLGLLPRPPRLLRPDPLLRRRRPRIGAVHPQAALQFRQPQLKPPLPFPHRIQLSPQQRVLRVLCLHHRTKPRVRSAQPRGIIRQELIRHAPQAPTPAATRQIDNRRNQTAAARLKTQATARTGINQAGTP